MDHAPRTYSDFVDTSAICLHYEYSAQREPDQDRSHCPNLNDCGYYSECGIFPVSGEERTKIKEEEFLNDLKKVNDTLGHEMGDIMILNFAKLLRKVVPLRYFVDRFGGDEFIVIAEDISGRLFRGTCPVCR